MGLLWLVLACSPAPSAPTPSPASPEEPPAGPQLVPLDAPPRVPEVAPTLPAQPEPPSGDLTARLAWLEAHAPLPIPDAGCAWLPPAPGCSRPAWVCTAHWSQTGGGGGAYGRDAIFGVEPTELAELRKRPTDQRMVPDPAEGQELVTIPAVDPELGPVFQLSRSDEMYGGPVYGTCIKEWEEAHATACDAACAKAAAHGEFTSWKGHSEAESVCEAKATRASGETSLRSCTVVLVDACTGHVGLECEGEKPRYSTPSFTDPAPDPSAPG